MDLKDKLANAKKNLEQKDIQCIIDHEHLLVCIGDIELELSGHEVDYQNFEWLEDQKELTNKK